MQRRNKFYLPANKRVYGFYPCFRRVHFQPKLQNNEEWWGAQRGQTKLRRGLKVNSGWAIITGPSQDNLVSWIIIANSLVITTRPSQDNIVIWMTIANSLAIIMSFTGKSLSLAFSDWYKTWYFLKFLLFCLQTRHIWLVWPSSSLPPPHLY